MCVPSSRFSDDEDDKGRMPVLIEAWPYYSLYLWVSTTHQSSTGMRKSCERCLWVCDEISWGVQCYKLSFLAYSFSSIHYSIFSSLAGPLFKHRGIAANGTRHDNPIIYSMQWEITYMPWLILTDSIFEALVISTQGILKAVCRSWSLRKFQLQRSSCVYFSYVRPYI